MPQDMNQLRPAVARSGTAVSVMTYDSGSRSPTVSYCRNTIRAEPVSVPGDHNYSAKTLNDAIIKLMLEVSEAKSEAREVRIYHMYRGEKNLIVNIDLVERGPQPKPQDEPEPHPWYKAMFIKTPMVDRTYSGKQARPKRCEKVTLRIPLAYPGKLEYLPYEFITLSQLQHLPQIPAPRVIAYDKSNENPLGRPYMIQEQLPGKTLDKVWHTLNTAQRASFARELAHIILAIYKVGHTAPGIVSVTNTSWRFEKEKTLIERIPIPRHKYPNKSYPYEGLAMSPDQTLRRFLLNRCNEHDAYAQGEGDSSQASYWRMLSMIIDAYFQTGLFNQTVPYRLHHSALVPKNILVVPRDDHSVAITGILGWDSALFAPAFVEPARAPKYLWTIQGCHTTNDRDRIGLAANDREAFAIERVFASVIGDSYARQMRAPEAAVLHGLWHLVENGIQSSEDKALAQSIRLKFNAISIENNRQREEALRGMQPAIPHESKDASHEGKAAAPQGKNVAHEGKAVSEEGKAVSHESKARKSGLFITNP